MQALEAGACAPNFRRLEYCFVRISSFDGSCPRNCPAVVRDEGYSIRASIEKGVLEAGERGGFAGLGAGDALQLHDVSIFRPGPNSLLMLINANNIHVHWSRKDPRYTRGGAGRGSGSGSSTR